MKPRIFTFGCSFTKWIWPTWANLLLYENEGMNFGVSGSSYEQVLHMLLECDRKFTINENDIVIINFTTPIRWDLILPCSGKIKWKSYGQTTTSILSKYENELFCVEGLLYRSFNFIEMIHEYLKSKNCKTYYTSVNDFTKNYGNYFEDFNFSNNIENLSNHIKNKVPLTIQDIFSYLYPKTKLWRVTHTWKDSGYEYHPLTLQHYEWIILCFPKEITNLLKVNEDKVKEINQSIKNFKGTMGACNEYLKSKYPEFYSKDVDTLCFLNDFDK
jgi:hypothetical protein